MVTMVRDTGCGTGVYRLGQSPPSPSAAPRHLTILLVPRSLVRGGQAAASRVLETNNPANSSLTMAVGTNELSRHPQRGHPTETESPQGPPNEFGLET